MTWQGGGAPRHEVWTGTLPPPAPPDGVPPYADGHEAVACDVAGFEVTLPRPPGSVYIMAVGHCGATTSPAGTDSLGRWRLPVAEPCP